MRLGKYLSELTKPELEELKDLLNLSDDEMVIFEKLSNGKSIEEISDKLKMSSRTVQRRITNIKNKLERVIE